MFKLVHRQIFKELVFMFLMTMGCLLGVILLGKLIDLRELLFSQNMAVSEILLLFFYLCPYFMLLLIPICSMLSVFLTFLRMSTDKEVTALRAGGVSLYQLLPAPVLFCLIAMGLCFLVSFHGISWGVDNFRETVVELIRTRTKLALQPGIFNQEFPDIIFYAHQTDHETGRMKFIFVQDRRQENISVNIVAAEGQISSDPRLGEVTIKFENGNIYQREGETLDVLQFGSYTIKLPLERLMGGYKINDHNPAEMSWAMLNDLNRKPLSELNKIEDDYASKIKVEIEKRVALPVGCFVLGLFALPISCIFTGLKQQYGLVLALGMFVVYYTMFSLGMNLGRTGALSAKVSMWIPNAMFFLIFLIMLRVASRERNLRMVTWVLHKIMRTA